MVKTRIPAPKNIKINERAIEGLSARKRRLMWLGVGVSAAIILLLWFFFWQFRPAPVMAPKAQTGDDFGQLINELTDTISGAKASLNNINQMIDQQSAEDGQEQNDELNDKLIDNLKQGVSQQLENKIRQSADQPETTTEDGEKVLIFK